MIWARQIPPLEMGLKWSLESGGSNGIQNSDLNTYSGGHFDPQRKNTFMGLPKNLPKIFQFFLHFWKVHELGFDFWFWVWAISRIFLEPEPFKKWLKMGKMTPKMKMGHCSPTGPPKTQPYMVNNNYGKVLHFHIHLGQIGHLTQTRIWWLFSCILS